MSKKNIILLHVFTWFFAAFVNLRNFSLLASTEFLTAYLVSTLFLIISFYTFYLFVVPQYLERKKYSQFVFVTLILLNLLTFSGYSLLLINKAFFSHNFNKLYSVYDLKMHLSGITVVAISATFGSFFKILISWLNAVNQKETLEKQKAISELSLIKSKVNPHFLFNTLNNIDALIYDNPDKASQALLKLSEIMRYMSYETTSEFVSLSKEIDYIKNIVELYKLRINNPDSISLSIPDGYANYKIAPMLFIPFIENAFKYSSFKGEKVGFEIKFDIADGIVIFSSENYYLNKPKSEQKIGGTGIKNVKQRLELIYPQKHLLEFADNGERFKVTMRINTNGI